MTGDLFFQSAVINMIICLWLVSIFATARLLLSTGKSLPKALSFGLLLGPLAMLIALIHRRLGKLCHKEAFFSLISIALVTFLVAFSFHRFFILRDISSTISNELLFKNIAIWSAAIGAIGGIILALLNRRVAFFESVWVVFFVSCLMLLLKDWVDAIFSFGTSTAYWSALIGSITSCLLLFLALGGSVGYLVFGEGRPNLRLGYESFIGVRFLMTKKSSQVVSLIAVISVVAVMVASSSMIVVMSVMNGFSSDLRSKILGANAHLMVIKYGKDFAEYKSVIKKTKDIDGVVEASPFILNEGMVSSRKNISGAMITGIDIDQMRRSDRLKYVSEQGLSFLRDPKAIPRAKDPNQEEGEEVLSGVIIGKEMASELQVMVGDVISLISPIGEMGPTGPIPRAKPFRVAGLFYSGMYEFDSKFAYILLKDAQEFFGMKDHVTGIEYRLSKVENTKAIAKEIDKAIGGYPYYSRDWMQMNRNMFSALQLEKIVMLIILGTLIFMASLLILVTLIMVVMEKGKEIAILKSMGGTDVSIMKIFVIYGLFVGSLGAFLGGVLGLSLCTLIERVGIRLDPDVYYFSTIPIKIITGEVFLVVGAAILLSFLATIPPSLFASRLRPVDGLRYE